MSIVIRPGQFRGDVHPVGKLATTLLSVTLAGMADPPRFRRGKVYVAEGAVTRLEVSTGLLKATVQGSRADPYEVIVAVGLAGRPPAGNADSLRPHLATLTPEARELMVSCNCPDWDDPCKHAVAGLLAFAAELTYRPELLLAWRCTADGDEAPPRRAGVGSRAAGRHLRLAPPPPSGPAASEPPSPFATPEWQAFLGASSLPSAPLVASERAPTGNGRLAAHHLGEWIATALDVLVDAAR